MTENSVPNPHPTPQPSAPPAVELSWDDIADGTLPPTLQQRLRIFVMSTVYPSPAPCDSQRL